MIGNETNPAHLRYQVHLRGIYCLRCLDACCVADSRTYDTWLYEVLWNQATVVHAGIMFVRRTKWNV